MLFVETWACPVSHRCRVGLPRLTPLLRGLAPSHTAAAWACHATLEHQSMTYYSMLIPASV
jgi:hypothetical protein